MRKPKAIYFDLDAAPPYTHHHHHCNELLHPPPLAAHFFFRPEPGPLPHFLAFRHGNEHGLGCRPEEKKGRAVGGEMLLT